MRELKKSVTIKVSKFGVEYKITVKYIVAQRHDDYPLLHKPREDCLDIFCEIDPAAGSTIGVFLELPVRTYKRDELLQGIYKAAEIRIGEEIAGFEKRKQISTEIEKRQENLNSYAENAARILEKGE